MPELPTPLTLGTSGLGRGTAPGSDAEAAAVDVAVDLLQSGHAYLDTSNNYSDGRSEAVIGLALERLSIDGSTRVISKVDAEPGTGRFDRDRVLRSFDETVARLGVERLPLLHLHDPYSVTFEEATASGGAVEGLIELRESGRVGGIGIASGPVPQVARYVETGLFDAVLVHNRFTIVDHSAGDLFADAHARGMTVFNAAPYGAGILATGAGEGTSYGYQPASDALNDWVRAVERICATHEVPLQSVALQYSLRSDAVDSTVVGVATAGRRQQLDDIAAVQVPDEIWARIDALGPAPSPIDDSEYA